MKWRGLFTTLFVFSATLAPIVAMAQDDPEEETPAQEAKPESTQEKWDKTIKDLVKTEGEFTLYTRKKEILAELNPQQFEKLFFIQATLNTGFGPLQGGDPLNENFIDVFKLRKLDETSVQLIRPNLGYRWEPNSPLALASQRAFPEAILANFKIEAINPKNQNLLLNISSIFSGKLFSIDSAIELAASGFSPDPQNSRPIKVKSFSENSIVQMQLHYKKESAAEGESLLAQLMGFNKTQLADFRSLPINVSYNMWFRRDTGYQSRLADPRIGYFTSEYFDVDKLTEVNRTVKLIQRWNLKKADPAATISDPVKPVVWYLDHSIPKEYREGVTQGILFWNKAFEKIGITNAMIVKDAPNDPDWDHADGRHNLIRWTMTEDQSYAVAWLRSDPISGEIINAAVTVDANYPAGAISEFREQVEGAKAKILDPELENQRILEVTKLKSKFSQLGFKNHSCDFAKEFQDRAAEGWALINSIKPETDEKAYVNAMLADLIAHEVGHCLGLRHNFAASLLHPMSDLSNDSLLAKTGVASSVMDYTPINIAAILNGGKTYWNPIVGNYDLWAIEYGYRSVTGNSPQSEKPALDLIAQRSGLPGLLYLTDEDADGVNPLAVRWDLGQDVLGYLRYQLVASEKLQQYAVNKATANGDTYTRRNALIMRSIRMRYRDAQNAVRMIGGVEFRRHLKGDVGEKPTLQPVSPQTQRAALIHLAEACLLPNNLDLPKDILMGMSGDPDAGGADYIAPLRGYIAGQQKLIVSQLLSSTKLDAIAENDFKNNNESQTFSLSDHFSMLNTAIFGEVTAQQEITALRRDLQKYAVAQMIRIVTSNPGAVTEDARVLAKFHLKKLYEQIQSNLKSNSNPGTITNLHLEDIAEQIDRTLKRQAVINPY